MNTRTLIQVLAITLFATRAFAAVTHQCFYEVRAPKSMKLNGLTAVDLVTDHSMSGNRLKFMKQREEDGFNVYANSSLLESGERRRALIIRADRGPEPSQVFVLTIPRTPKPADWSKWQRPTYIEKSDASWTFLHDLKKHDRSTNIPPNCLEIRFRITKWDESKLP